MARYVNFDQMVDKINHELKRSLNSVYFCEDGTKISTDVGYVAEWFEDYVIKLHQIPLVDAVDVAPVVHGEWEEYPDWSHLRCTNCKIEFERIKMPRTRHFCPNCGADMRKRRKDG